MNSDQFYDYIDSLPQKVKNRDLEEYLLALLLLIEENKEKAIDYEFIIELLTKAFTTKPAKFKEEWLEYNNPPDENRINHKFTTPAFKDAVDKTNTSDLSPFEFTIAVLKFQIADLHKMRGKQLDNEYRYFGIDSETGHRWYNFDPFTNLECGSSCIDDNETAPDSLDWSFIGELLENGRIYE